MDVCEMCGAVGYKHLLVQCNNCQNASRHRYCLDQVIYNVSLIEWFCDDCRPKHNEDTKSLERRSGDHHSIHLSSISINEPNVNRVELTKKMWSWWGHRRQRSHKARRDSMAECIKHFPSGDTSNSSKIFAEPSSPSNGHGDKTAENREVLCARKKHKTCAGNDAMNRGSAVNYEEMLLARNLNNRNANNNLQAKKQRSMEFHGDKHALFGHPSVGYARNDAAQFASRALAADDHHNVSRMTATSSHIDQRVNICMQPIDKPYWTGIMKIDHKYISLAAHFPKYISLAASFPNQACKKAHKLSRSLPPVMKVTKHSKSKAWPKNWGASEAPADSIGLYFLSQNMRPNEDLDRVVQCVTDHSIVLKYVVGFADLLIFPSILLPKQFQLFQGKHYLWGVFERRRDMSKAGTQVNQKVCTPDTMETKEQQQDKVQCDTLDQEMPVSKEQQEKVQCDTLDEEIPVSKERQHNVQCDSLNQEMHISKYTMPSDPLDQEIERAWQELCLSVKRGK